MFTPSVVVNNTKGLCTGEPASPVLIKKQLNVRKERL